MEHKIISLLSIWSSDSGHDNFFGMAVSEETIPFKTDFEEISCGVMKIWN